MIMKCVFPIAFAIFVTLVGCGDDPVAHSSPVSINLKVKSDDVANGVLSERKSITSESGNPYGKFMSDARDALGGNEPSHIEINRLELFLGASSTGVSTIGEVFSGAVDVLL